MTLALILFKELDVYFSFAPIELEFYRGNQGKFS